MLMYPEASVGVAMWEASGRIVAWWMVRNVAVANHVTMLVFVLLARHSMMIRQLCGVLFVRSV